MKKIINGKLYNTDSAQEVGTYSNSTSYRDFNHIFETLYLKRTGEFFLHCEGGAATQYARRVDNNSWCDGECIKPLTREQAMQWAEENLDADEYIELFGEVEE